MSFTRNLSLVILSWALFVAQSHAYRNDFLVKLRGGFLSSDEALQQGSKGTTPTQKFDKGLIAELGLSYFLHNNFAVELSAGYSWVDYFNLSRTKSVVSCLPATATVQFHLPIFNTVFPYAGVGYSYRFFFQEPTGVDIRDAGNIVYQAGLDFIIPRSEWGFNIDFKYVPALQHDVTENNEVFKNSINSISLMAGAVVKF